MRQQWEPPTKAVILFVSQSDKSQQRVNPVCTINALRYGISTTYFMDSTLHISWRLKVIKRIVLDLKLQVMRVNLLQPISYNYLWIRCFGIWGDLDN